MSENPTFDSNSGTPAPSPRALGEQRVQLLLSAKRYDQALQAAHHEMATHGESAVMWAYTAAAHSMLEQPELTLQAVGNAVRLNPEFSFPHQLAAEAFLSLDQPEQAYNAALEAIRLDPNDADGHALLARATVDNLTTRHYAQQAAHRAVTLEPHDAEKHNVYGIVAMNSGDWATAEKAFTEALRLNPHSDTALHNLGIVRLKRRDFASAAEHLSHSAALDPQATESRHGFFLLVQRWLWFTHLMLAVAVFIVLGVALGDADQQTPGIKWHAVLLTAACLAGLGLWTKRTVGKLSGHLRSVVWQIVKRRKVHALWLGCLALATVGMALAALSPWVGLRMGALITARVAVLVGVVASWIGYSRWSRRRQRR